jgi:hypothetical protein
VPLVSVKVNVEIVPAGVAAGAKTLVSATCETCKFAVLDTVPAVGVWVVVTPLVVFGCNPAVALVTSTVTVQLPLAGKVMPVKLSAVVPLVNDAGVMPVQVPPTT